MGFDLIALLAVLPSDPLSSLRYQTTYNISRRGRIARVKAAGVPHFFFSSTSNPVTPHGESNVSATSGETPCFECHHR
jgi:hypothetical protein